METQFYIFDISALLFLFNYPVICYKLILADILSEPIYQSSLNLKIMITTFLFLSVKYETFICNCLIKIS